MGKEIDLMDRYPKSKRPVDERAQMITEEHRRIARQFGKEFFDGDRLYGYGGYNYHPRFWTETVKRFRDYYNLPEDTSILDVGSGRGFMLYDFKLLMPKAKIQGIDMSGYAIETTKEEMKPYMRVGNAKKLDFPDKSFDLVISINTVHNLALEECKQALREIERVSKKHSFIVVDAYRNEEEKKRLEAWILTGLTCLHVKEWEKVFREVGYTGDYYWFTA
ncbi:MAG: methyltransferase type 11 [Deltaproteobacteria bacterium RIFCSPLOWO2_02_FULL_46_8]|nr:MAG: methyltransferase type 11 [Deltaproteobacteria bacterium RIFCSPLOWO2_02_FULL_46_8]